MGAWIEIYKNARVIIEAESRTPRWVRGLKLAHHNLKLGLMLSHPTMGAWIEISSFNDAKLT